MNTWFPRKRAEREQELLAVIDRLTDKLAETEQKCDAYKAAAETAARQFTAADAANIRLDGRVKRLTEQLSDARASKYDCAAHGAELADQARVVERLTEQLFDSMGYTDAERAALRGATQPAHADAA